MPWSAWASHWSGESWGLSAFPTDSALSHVDSHLEPRALLLDQYLPLRSLSDRQLSLFRIGLRKEQNRLLFSCNWHHSGPFCLSEIFQTGKGDQGHFTESGGGSGLWHQHDKDEGRDLRNGHWPRRGGWSHRQPSMGHLPPEDRKSTRLNSSHGY